MARPIKKVPGRVDKYLEFKTALKVGDPVYVTTGGNKKAKKQVAGLVGKILRFVPKKHRVVVEGVNFIKRHKKARTATEQGGIITKEGTIHISNVMYYSEKLKRPVRLKSKTMEDGRKVRVYTNPETKKLENVD